MIVRIITFFNLILFALTDVTEVIAQETAQNVIPPPPNAAALGLYTEIPVSKYTGIPGIRIPLTTVQSGDLRHDISMNYHAGGIRVAQESSWLGLGWSLNAGGVISRTIQGTDDLKTTGYAFSPEVPNERLGDNWGFWTWETNSTWEYLISANCDTEPDIFFYSFGPYSGKIILKKCFGCTNIDAVNLTPNALKISYDWKNMQWTIIDGDGILYLFDRIEESINFSKTQKIPFAEGFDPVGPGHYLPEQEYISSWYLSSIAGPMGDSITFAYKSEGFQSRSVVQRSEEFQRPYCISDPTSGGNSYSASVICTDDVYLESIHFSNGSIQFQTEDRLDILPFNEANETVYDPQRLKRMDIFYGENAKPDRTVIFYNDGYFGSGDPQLFTRLKLDSIGIHAGSSRAMPPYKFDYNIPPSVPPKNSFSVDHWGFFNDAPNDRLTQNDYGPGPATLIPTDFSLIHPYTGQPIVLMGADRSANDIHSQLFVLRTITYPTGGTQTFEYELNTFPQGDWQSEIWNTKTQTVSQQVYTSNVMMDECGNYGTDSGERAVEFDISMTTVAEYFAGSAMNECISCYNEDENTVFEPYPPFDYSQYDGTVYGYLELLDNTGNVSVTIRKIRFYYYGPETNTADNDGFTSVQAQCAAGGFPLSTEQYRNFTTLYPGRYRLRILPLNGLFTEVSLSYKDRVPVQNPGNSAIGKGGGLRIKSIIYSDGENERVKRYEYAEQGSGTTGILMKKPLYTTIMGTNDKIWIPAYTDHNQKNQCAIYASSTSIVPMGTSAQGSFVGYSVVVEHDGSAKELGSIHSYFLNEAEYTTHDPLAPGIPGGIRTDNGLLDHVDYFDKNLQLLKTERFDYELDGKTKLTIPTGKFFRMMDQTDPRSAFAFYDIHFDWWKLAEEETIVYYDGNALSTVKEFQYNPVNKKVEKIKSRDSNGSVLETEYNYAVSGKYEQNPSLGSDLLTQSHRINPALETIQKVNGQTTYSQKNRYESEHGLVVLKMILEFPEGQENSGKIVELKYNKFGRPIEVKGTDGMVKTYVWGYNHSYPVAEIMNISSDEAKKIPGFNEDLDVGTGGLPDALESQLRQISNVAYLSRYDYQPGKGITAQWDINNVLTSYEYDVLGRLYLISDTDNNMLKRYGYHYKMNK